MNYDRVVAAALASTSLAAVDDPILELLCPANITIDLIRVELGATEGATPPVSAGCWRGL